MRFFYIPKRSLRKNPSKSLTNSDKPVYIDLFAGCGGLSLGLHKSGWKGLFAIEKSPHAFETLSHNLIDKLDHFDWPDWLAKKNHDINDILAKKEQQLKELRGKVDLVAGGPPCQGFSSAGKRVESDSRNGLIESYLRFISLVQPKVVFFENVKGFTLQFQKNKSKGQAYAEYVKERFEKDLGYNVHGELLDFSDFGIPQKRTRFILIGIKKSSKQNKELESAFFEKLRDSSRQFLVNKNLSIKSNLQQAISDLLASRGKVECKDRNGFESGIYGKANSLYQRYLRKGKSMDIPDSHSFPKHRHNTIKRFKTIIEKAEKNKSLNKSLKEELGIKKHTTIPLKGNCPSPTITTLPDDYVHYSEPRILTVREYARIQSFPDWYQFQGKYTTGGTERVNEVPRYSQIGNAIPPLFAEQAGITLKSLID